ncbi:superoxide dismutase [Desulfoluna sp.]|uniref:superoxide dismutase n=1 Tax=Desulfoluna sp. TaxID=2045199 RepID=UPI002613B0DD|nr:superoxide dismutase [Desulfoluna sp.]
MPTFSSGRPPHTRHFSYAVALCLVVSLLFIVGCAPEPKGPALTLAPLPWARDALEPIISARTLSLHYGKHHAGYVIKANALIEKSRFKRKSVEKILSATRGKNKYEALYNNTAQAWNHAFFWGSLTPKGGARPAGPLAEAINREFNGWKGFRSAFIETALSHFGSGWVWLVKDKKTLRIITTSDADTPIAQGLTPLFTIDLWEHAYYLDYHNKRKVYVEGVFDGLAHWKKAEQRYRP